MRGRTTDDLLRDLRARVAAPENSGLLSTSEILSLCDQEMEGEIGPLLISARSEYWLRTADQAITPGKSEYRIPDRSLAMGLRDVIIRDSAGNEWNATQVAASQRHLSRLRPRGSAPFDFSIYDGKVVLLPTPAQEGYTLRLRYYATPSRLVQLSDAARIVNFAYDTAPPGTPGTPVLLNGNNLEGATQVEYFDLPPGEVEPFPGPYWLYFYDFVADVGEYALVTGAEMLLRYTRYLDAPLSRDYNAGSANVAYAGSAIGTGVAGLVLATDASDRVTELDALVDVVRGGGMHDQIAESLSVSSWDDMVFQLGVTLTPDQTADISIAPNAISNGGRQDYVCVAGETVFPPIPNQLWPTFVNACARAYCEAIGDVRGFEVASAMLAQRKRGALEVMVPRVDGETVRPIPRNTPLRGGGRRFRGGY